MEKRSFIILIYLSIFICFSCVTQSINSQKQSEKQVYQNWIGRKKSEIIISWGPPMSGTTPDGNGGEILLYVSSRTFTGRPPGNLNLPMMSRTISDYKYVYCNPEGIIYFIKYGRE